MAVIPYKNGLALGAYYCGVFGLIPCVGSVLGPTALVLGILGIRKANREPAVEGMGHAITGIVLGSIEIVLYVILPLIFVAIQVLRTVP
jgi:hypothetical protein